MTLESIIEKLREEINQLKFEKNKAYQQGKDDMSENCNNAVDERTRAYNEKLKVITKQAEEIEGLNDIILDSTEAAKEVKKLEKEIKGLKLSGCKCICGAKMRLFESNYGGHEGQYCLVCSDRFNENPVHLESNKWYPDKYILKQALAQKEPTEAQRRDVELVKCERCGFLGCQCKVVTSDDMTKQVNKSFEDYNNGT